MKSILRILIIATLFFSKETFSQHVNYIDDSGWNLGFNTGGTWQNKELVMLGNDTNYAQPFTSVRGGFTFGKTVAYFPSNRFFALDLRFRYLRGINYGWATKTSIVDSINPSFQNYISAEVFRNYRMDLNEFTLEGVLSLHKLREQTGILLYGFGGLGITDYRVKADYLNGQNPYNYSSIPNFNTIQGNDRKSAREIKQISDLEFETVILPNQLKFMPSLGIGIGYQINPYFSMGFEHKITYALTSDINGFNYDNLNDRYHYTAIRLNFDLRNKHSGESNYYYDEDDTDDEPISPTINPTTSTSVSNTNNPITTDDVHYNSNGLPPIVNITNPSHTNMKVHGSLFYLKARAYNVNSKSQIVINNNGDVVSTSDYSFDKNSSLIFYKLELSPGQNVIEISATNNYGFDQDETIIIYARKILGSPPVVDITNPLNYQTQTQHKNVPIKAYILNVNKKSDVEYYVDGKQSTSFLFNTSTKLFSSNVTLKEGTNEILIKGINEYGRDSSKREIILNTPETLTVKITNPATNNITTQDQQYNVVAVSNVKSMQEIKQVLVNQQPVTYDFFPSSGEIKFTATLHQGPNEVFVKVQNDYSMDDDGVVINHQDLSNQLPPDVSITTPSTDPFVTQHENINAKALLLRVDNRSDVTVKLNNKNITNFSFDPTSKILEVNLNLKEGKNNLYVVGNNDFGSDNDNVNIEYQKVQLLSPPVITITYPQENNFTTANNLVLIQGTIEHVDKYENATALINNVASKKFLFNPSSINFQCEVQLNPGANTFNVQAFNDVGTAQKTIVLNHIQRECDNPEIQMINPTTNIVNTNNNKASIMAKIINTQTIRFKENGNDIQGYNFNVNTGDFSTMINLTPGSHSYEIIAYNTCGIVTETVTFNYGNKVTCQDPVINWVSPSSKQNKLITNHKDQLVSLNLKGVSKQNQVQLLLNGITQQFTFDPSSGDLNALLSCNLGLNSLVVKADNGCTPVSTSKKIEYINAISKPEIVLSSHNNSFNRTSSSTAKITGVIQNISNKNQINVVLNGNAQSFNFDHVSKKITIDATLQNGVNQFEIHALNKAGGDSKAIEIIKEGPPPVIKVRKYNGFSSFNSPFKVNSNLISISAYVYHDDKSSKFEFSTSPSDAGSVKFIPSNGFIVGNLSLDRNKVTSLTMSITNAFGAVSKKIYFIYGYSDLEEEQQGQKSDYYTAPTNNSSNSSNKYNSSSSYDKEEENDSGNQKTNYKEEDKNTNSNNFFTSPIIKKEEKSNNSSSSSSSSSSSNSNSSSSSKSKSSSSNSSSSSSSSSSKTSTKSSTIIKTSTRATSTKVKSGGR